MAPVQRDGMEYEFDVVGDMDWQHTLVVSKTRCEELSEAVIKKPGKDFAAVLSAWVGSGEKPQAKPKAAAAQVRKLIKERMTTGEWEQAQVAALLATHNAEKLAQLSPEGLETVWNTLTNETGESWQGEQTA